MGIKKNCGMRKKIEEFKSVKPLGVHRQDDKECDCCHKDLADFDSRLAAPFVCTSRIDCPHPNIALIHA
jgi:hypothetical protein